jgi:hypothetical protein
VPIERVADEVNAVDLAAVAFQVMQRSAGRRGTGDPVDGMDTKCEFDPLIARGMGVDVEYGKRRQS